MSEKESNQKGSMYILAIVGIVAIVSVVVLILGKGNTGNDLNYDSDLSGEAITATTGSCTDSDGGNDELTQNRYD